MMTWSKEQRFIKYLIHPDGSLELEALRGVTLQQIRSGQRLSMDVRHYNDEGCRCDDLEHRQHMIEH